MISPGARLGPYEILSALGAGGMGEVYRARDTKLDREVAIKVLPELFVADPERVARFQREAKTLAALNHPNIGGIYGLADASGVHALVLELVEGPTLADRIAEGPILLDEALPIARQIAEALEAAHEAGIIHRDLKPANIKLRPDGTVKVLDFGLAKALEPTSAASASVTASPTITTPAMMTGIGMILGTAAYMSPEQAKGRPADKRSDIWAFGCVLLEMLSAKRAFEGEDVTDIIAAVVRGEPDWSVLPDNVPEHIRLLLRRCLKKDRSKRVSDISTALFLITEAIEPTVPRVAPSGALPVARRRPLWKRAAPLALTVMVLSVTGAAVWMARPTSTPAPVARFSFILGEGQSFTNTGRHLTAISPDGRQMVFVANQQLYLRELASLATTLIAGTATANGAPGGGITTPVFSPDGRSLAFFSGLDRTLKRVAVSGGAAVTICPADNPFGMSWDDSGIIFGQGSKGVLRVSANGGKPEVLVSVRNDEFADAPQVLPGGKDLLFTLAKGTTSDRWEQAQVVVQALKSGDRKVLIDPGSDARYVPTGHLVYARGGVLFAISFDVARLETTGTPVPVVEGVRRAIGGLVAGGPGSPTGAAQFSTSNTGSLMYVPGPATLASEAMDLALVDRAGAVERLKLPAGRYGHVRMSPQGRRVVFSANDGKEDNAYVYALGSGTPMQRLTFGGNNRFPIWTADSKRIAFQSDRSGDRGIFWQPADGSGTAERLTRAEDGSSHIPESWSPTRDLFLYTITKGSRVTLWVYSIPERKGTRFDGVESSTLIGSVFSPDGRWVAYSADNTIYVQPFPPTGSKYQLPNASGAHHPVWSPDGKELYYEPTINQLFVVPVRIQPGLAFGNPVSLPAGAFGTTNPAFARNRDIDSDGKRFITPAAADPSQRGTTQPEIRVVLNWFEELKARVPTK